MKHKAVEYEGSSFKVSFIFKQIMKGNGLGDLKRFSCEALQHEYSSQFLSVDSTRSEDVFQTWVPQVLLIPRPWKIS